MVLKGVFSALLGAALIAGGAASAADYRPDEFLNLDLSKAVLSPKRLGPPSEFAPVAIEARTEPSGVLAPNDAKKVAVERVKGAPVRTELTSAVRRNKRLAHAQGEKPREAARARLARHHGNPMNAQAARLAHHHGNPTNAQAARLAHHHGNPMNAQAMDSRIQKWPCNPDNGGICAWQR